MYLDAFRIGVSDTPRSLSRSEMEHLGRRLAEDRPPSPEDLDLLSRFQGDYEAAVDSVVAVLRDRLRISKNGLFDGVALTVSTRPLKTIETLIEKLRRGIPLRTVQDIAGIRIVGDLALSQQDDLRRELQRCFSESRIDVDDRRLTPSFGYRAVHVIPFVEGFPIEIQIRTTWQDVWAQGSEKIGDVWGRWHRYGLPPEGGTLQERERRSKWIAQYRVLGDALYSHELALDRKFLLRREEEDLLLAIQAGSTPQSPGIQRLRDLLAEATTAVIGTNRAITLETERLKAMTELESGE